MMGRTALLFLLPALSACADLSPITEGTCGNAVLDPKEDCDTEVDVSLGGGTACGASTPLTDESCRYVCTEGTLCPLGWDCGADQICRQPSSVFIEGPPIPDWSPTSFEPVDFNGDGRTDLVGAFGDHIEFRMGEPGGTFAEGFEADASSVIGPVAVGRLDSDPLDGRPLGDVLLPTDRGLLVWRGQEAGPPLQVAYAPYSRNGAEKLRVIPVAYPAPEGEYMSMVLYEDTSVDGPKLGACVYDGAKVHTCSVIVKEHGFDEIKERLTIADFDLDGSEEIAIGFESSTVVRVFEVRQDLLLGGYSVGGLGGSLGSALEVEVSEPCLDESCTATATGLTVAHGVHAADVDGDGNPDLLVSVADPASKDDAVVVVRGDGAGGFYEPYLDSRFELLASPSTVAEGFSGQLGVWPIAAGDLDEDGDADYVSPNGLFLGAGDELVQVLQRDTPYPWTAAVFADVDGDEDVDVVAITAGQPRVDVVRCSSSGLSCKRRGEAYTTKQGVTHLRSASLQGGPVTDIVLVERAPEGSEEEDALSVMYGMPSEWPSDPLLQARFYRIDQADTGRLRFPGWPIVDWFDDVVISTRNREEELALGVLWSNGTKVLNSPYFAETADSRAKRAIAGRFSGGDNDYQDVLMLGEDAGKAPRAWWVPGAEDAAFAPTVAGHNLRTAFNDPDFELDCARFAVGDIDLNARDEVIVLSGQVSGQAECAESAATRVFVVSVSEGAQLSFATLADLSVGEAEGDSHMALVDVDGGGSDDLILARTGAVEVSFGGSSGLGPLELLLELPSDEKVLDVRGLSRDERGRGPSRVAVLTSASVFVISANRVATEIQSEGATKLRSADVDGDGLGDLLLLGDQGVRVLLTVPARLLGDG